MTDEENSEEIVDFTLIPVGAIVKTSDARNGRGFIGVGLDTNARVVAHGKEVVDNFETLIAGGKVNSCYV